MSNLLSKKIIVPVVAIVVIGGSVAWYLMTKSSDTSSNEPTKTSFVGSTNDNKTAPDQKSKQSISSDGSNSSSSTGTKPQIPNGTFVSNHHPNIDNEPAPSNENSTCITSVGATCRITFTKGTTVKSLPSKTVGSTGAVIWNWKVQDIGLTAGEWKITAIASNGSLTSSASDPLVLTVGN
jgi:hypothetical protein